VGDVEIVKQSGTLWVWLKTLEEAEQHQ